MHKPLVEFLVEVIPTQTIKLEAASHGKKHISECIIYMLSPRTTQRVELILTATVSCQARFEPKV